MIRKIGYLVLFIVLLSCNNNKKPQAAKEADKQTEIENQTVPQKEKQQELSYEEKISTIEGMENRTPTKFLTSGGKSQINVWGTKFKIHGTIKNTATMATYKDAVIEVTYYSKTKTTLFIDEFTVFEFFPPNSEKAFEWRVNNHKNATSVSWQVIRVGSPELEFNTQ